MPRRVAVVLFNLGGPDSLQSVKPFLFNLFNDPAIIDAPTGIRYLLGKFISWRRDKKAQAIYEKIGNKSPILENTLEQAKDLKRILNIKSQATSHNSQKYEVFTCMRYWHPRASEIVKQVKEYNPDKIILLPLYPQFSTTTSGSSLNEWKKEADNIGLDIPATQVCCYYDQGSFVRAHAAQIRDYYSLAKTRGVPRVLFSAHGLPEKIIKKGDPYQWQVEQTAKAIVEILNIKDLDWRVCYQSKVGPMKWIGPSTEEEIIEAAEDGGVALVVVPVAFVSEHSETLVELDVDYKGLAENNGLRDYFRVPALGTHELFVYGLKEICQQAAGEGAIGNIFCAKESCPKDFGCCPCNI